MVVAWREKPWGGRGTDLERGTGNVVVHGNEAVDATGEIEGDTRSPQEGGTRGMALSNFLMVANMGVQGEAGAGVGKDGNGDNAPDVYDVTDLGVETGEATHFTGTKARRETTATSERGERAPAGHHLAERPGG